MKRFLCILLCLLLAAPAALADTYTPTRLFRQQFITGGNGLRGTVAITASGVAEWLDLLLPFTAANLQVRIIGERQGSESELVADDDDWQVKLWTKDAQGAQRGLTYLYGGPEAIYLRSELLPETFLTLPVQGVNLPYQLSDAEFGELFSAFDPLGLMEAESSGNVTAWSALLELGSIGEEAWAASWAPVLQKYETLVDMWLNEYASPTVVSGSAGSMTLRTSYDIPVEALKAEAKYIIGLMLVDGELQGLLAPYLTEDQRSLYVNPAMQWFYNHCIDAVPLSGSILFEREMTMMGETASMNISLPLPPLPSELTQPLSECFASVLGLPYGDVFAGLERISVRQSGEDIYVSLSSDVRTISLIVDERAENAESLQCEGYIRITPAVGVEEAPLNAAFTYSNTHRLWEDDDYNTHEDFAWSVQVQPDTSLNSESDPFHSTYLEFAPVSFSSSIGYTKKERASSPVQLAIALQAVLPEAEVGVTASLKVAERWEHELLPTEGAEDLTTMSEERREELRTLLITNAVQTMSTLSAAPAETGAAQ